MSLIFRWGTGGGRQRERVGGGFPYRVRAVVGGAPAAATVPSPAPAAPAATAPPAAARRLAVVVPLPVTHVPLVPGVSLVPGVPDLSLVPGVSLVSTDGLPVPGLPGVPAGGAAADLVAHGPAGVPVRQAVPGGRLLVEVAGLQVMAAGGTRRTESETQTGGL